MYTNHGKSSEYSFLFSCPIVKSSASDPGDPAVSSCLFKAQPEPAVPSASHRHIPTLTAAAVYFKFGLLNYGAGELMVHFLY